MGCGTSIPKAAVHDASAAAATSPEVKTTNNNNNNNLNNGTTMSAATNMNGNHHGKLTNKNGGKGAIIIKPSASSTGLPGSSLPPINVTPLVDTNIVGDSKQISSPIGGSDDSGDEGYDSPNGSKRAWKSNSRRNKQGNPEFFR
jgi:hypothetical protein